MSQTERGGHLALNEHGHEAPHPGIGEGPNAFCDHPRQEGGVDFGKGQRKSSHHLGGDHVVRDFIHRWIVASATGSTWQRVLISQQASAGGSLGQGDGGVRQRCEHGTTPPGSAGGAAVGGWRPRLWRFRQGPLCDYLGRPVAVGVAYPAICAAASSTGPRGRRRRARRWSRVAGPEGRSGRESSLLCAGWCEALRSGQRRCSCTDHCQVR